MRYLILALCLAGCETMQETRDREAREQAARAEAYRQHVAGQCKAYGFEPGTDRFRECLMQVDLAYRAHSEAQRQMILQQYINQHGIFRR